METKQLFVKSFILFVCLCPSLQDTTQRQIDPDCKVPVTQKPDYDYEEKYDYDYEDYDYDYDYNLTWFHCNTGVEQTPQPTTTEEVTTDWPYDYRFYCWTSFYDCHHPASTPFPGVNWKYLNTKYGNQPFRSPAREPWWQYRCFYYTEEALTSLLQPDLAAVSYVTCAADEEDMIYALINGTWFEKFPNYDSNPESDYNLFQLEKQPSKLEDFFGENNFTGSDNLCYLCCLVFSCMGLFTTAIFL